MRLWDNAAALKRLYRWLYFCVILCLIGAVGLWLVNSPYFPIKRVEVAKPLQRVSGQQVEAIVRQYLHGNIFKADVNAAQGKFAKLPWVAQAQVKRLWPDKVVVNLSERQPVARWGARRLVDSNGELFDATTDEPLPRFVAAGETEAADVAKPMARQLESFQAALQPTGLKIAELHYSERSAWALVLDNGIIVRLGRDDVDTRLQRFVWAWPQVLQVQAANIHYVDMRYKDGFALRPRDRQVAASAAAEE